MKRWTGRRAIPWIAAAAIALCFAILAGDAHSGLKESQTEEPGRESDYAVYGVSVPEKVSFAGEPLPLDLFDVRESLDRELVSNTYFHSQTIRMMKLANRYFPQIEPVLKSYLVPDDFKYLVLAESGLTHAVSPAGAVGFWQLMKGTARDYGLEVGSEVDERYHVVKSTEVACQYLVESFRKYGNWTMAAASYNAGRRGVDRQIARQKIGNYYDLLLTEETARYLFRVVAMKLIFEDPAAYGFHISERDLYPEIPTYAVAVDSSIADFADFAAEHGINYKILKYFNPWLRDTHLTNSTGKTYEILLPEKGFRRAHAWEER